MNESIKAGDLVQVVHWPCCTGALGEIHAVERVFSFNASHCGYCGAEHGADTFAEIERRCGIPIAWLKRIPPLSELEGEKRDERIEI